MEFKEYKLADITEKIYSGGTPSTKEASYWNGELKWLSSGETSNRFIISTEKTITQKGVENSSTKLAFKNDLVMASAGQGYTRGQTSFLKIDTYINQSLIAISVNKDKVHPLYLFYNLISRYAELRQISDSSSTRGSINTKMIKNLNIMIPEKSHQNRIVYLINSIDEKIEINKKIIANLEELSQTLFKRWFVDFEFPDEDGNPYKSSGEKLIESELGDIPEGWEIQKINQIVNFINGHAFKSKELYKYNKNKKMYHVFKMGHIKQGGGLKSDATKSFYPKGIEKKLEKFVLKKGDILMSMTDMKNKVAILGNTALMNRDDKYIVNQRVGLLRLKEDTYIDYPFLYILTNSNEFLTTLRKKANSGVQVNLTSKAIKEQLVIVPSKNYHNKFNMITKPIYLKIFDLEIENEYLTILRDTLLPKLMSGELEIPDDIEVNTDELSI